MSKVYLLEGINRYNEREIVGIFASKEKVEWCHQVLEYRERPTYTAYITREFDIDSVLESFKAELEEDLKRYERVNEYLEKLKGLP